MSSFLLWIMCVASCSKLYSCLESKGASAKYMHRRTHGMKCHLQPSKTIRSESNEPARKESALTKTARGAQSSTRSRGRGRRTRGARRWRGPSTSCAAGLPTQPAARWSKRDPRRNPRPRCSS
eukprot:scaffold2022_cov261-Pinguiococcus_pyrenoidosus.AAC.19